MGWRRPAATDGLVNEEIGGIWFKNPPAISWIEAKIRCQCDRGVFEAELVRLARDFIADASSHRPSIIPAAMIIGISRALRLQSLRAAVRSILEICHLAFLNDRVMLNVNKHLLQLCSERGWSLDAMGSPKDVSTGMSRVQSSVVGVLSVDQCRAA
jgi:hypothetical protein